MLPAAIAAPSAATMPNVDPNQTATASDRSPASVIVANCVLSPSYEMKKEAATTPKAPKKGKRRATASPPIASPRTLQAA